MYTLPLTAGVLGVGTGYYGWRRLRVARNVTAAMRVRAVASAQTLTAVGGVVLFSWLVLSRLPVPQVEVTGTIEFSLIVFATVCAAAYSAVALFASRVPDATTYRALLAGVIRTSWTTAARQVPAFVELVSRARPDEAGRPAVGGRRRWVVIAALSLGFGVMAMMIYGSGSNPIRLGREFAFLWATSVLLSCTMPVFVTWVSLSFVTGRSRVISTLREASDLVGIGLVAGFITGSVAFYFNALGGIPPLQDPSSFSFDTIVGASLFGSVVGFAVAHLRVLISAARGFPRSWKGYALAAGLSIVTASITSAYVSPRTIAGRLVDSMTVGVAVPTGPTGVATDWRVVFLASKQGIVAAAPTTEWFVAGFAVVAIASLSVCLLGDAIRTARDDLARRG